jgi:Lrp/AsnC family transcriptional regulator for asnA, asnC and gidA
MDFNCDDNRRRALDSRLIELLQRDAYRPNTDIARQLKVGESTVHRRIQSLIRLGYLKITGVADPFKLGFAVWVIIELEVDPVRVDDVAAEVARFAEVAFVAVTTGATDIWLHAMFRSHDEVYKFISKRLGKVGGIRRCDTATVLRIKKRSFEYGVAEAARATNHHARRGARSSTAAGHPKIGKRKPRRPS